MCITFGSELVYRQFSQCILGLNSCNLKTANLIVQTLEYLIITEKKLNKLRNIFKDSLHTTEGTELFNLIFKAFC